MKKLLSPCHNATIDFALGDGVQIGSCSECQRSVVRINPHNGHEEWLDGHSPWTSEDLRLVDESDRK